MSTRDRIRRNQLHQGVIDLRTFLHSPNIRGGGAAAGFCQAVQLEVAGKVWDRDWDDLDMVEDGDRNKWVDFPWLTLVLGSGPAGLPDPFWGVVRRLPELVSKGLSECRTDGTTLAELYESVDVVSQRFVENLTTDRIGDDDEDPDAENSTEKLTPFTASLVLLAAQLTRVFHQLSLRSNRPISRWGVVVARIPVDQTDDKIRDEISRDVNHLRRIIKFVLGRLRHHPPDWMPGEEFMSAVEALLVAVRTNLDHHGDHHDLEILVNLDHLREVTDVAWQALVWETSGSSYPGWTELMLDLVLLQERNDDVPVERKPRWTQLVSLSSDIEGIMRPATERSFEQRWATRGGYDHPPLARQSDATRDFYHAAAELLWQQAAAGRPKARRSGAPRNVAMSLPKAVAFVTSFDLELEMALLHTLSPDNPEKKISVVVPVYLAHGQEDEGDFLWLEAEIDLAGIDLSNPHNGHEVINRLTTTSEWRVMYNDRIDLPDHPIIVRLTGSPLMTLPDPRTPDQATHHDDDSEHETLANGLKYLGLDHDLANAHFVHSATVDDYLAMRQAEHESYWVYSQTSNVSTSRRPVENRSRALPTALLNCREQGPIRFWMTVGVPIKDPAVRLRLLGQMGINRRSITEGRKGAAGDVPGIAVNWRLDDEEATLLSSLGLKVIKQGRAEDLGRHIAHHAWHLSAFATGDKPRAGTARCPREPKENS